MAVMVKGPAMFPIGPTMRTIDWGVIVAGFIGRSKVMSMLLTVLFSTRLSVVTGFPFTAVFTTCGPGMMIGSVSVVKPGWKNDPVKGAALEPSGLGMAK